MFWENSKTFLHLSETLFSGHTFLCQTPGFEKFLPLNSTQDVRGPGALFYQFEENCTFLCTIWWTISIQVYMNLQRASKMAKSSFNKSFNNCSAFLIWVGNSFGPFLKSLHHYLYILITLFDLRKGGKECRRLQSPLHSLQDMTPVEHDFSFLTASEQHSCHINDNFLKLGFFS